MKRFPAPLRMQTILISCLCGLIGFSTLLAPTVQAQQSVGYGFSPEVYKEGYNFGTGIYFAPYDFTVYSQPDENAPVVGAYHWNHKTSQDSLGVTDATGNKRSVTASHVFFCFYPQLDVAMLAVTGDDGKGWAEVVVDQAKKTTGWVHLRPVPKTAAPEKKQLADIDAGEPAYFGQFETWQDFMKLNAEADGIYWMSGVNEYQRSLRSSDSDEGKVIPVTVIRSLKVRHIRGNWLLVEVVDFERNTPIGWVRWRDDDGNLMVFPNLSGAHLPIVTTAE